MEDDINYNDIFDQIKEEREKKEGKKGEPNKETGMIELLEDGKVIGHQDPLTKEIKYVSFDPTFKESVHQYKENERRKRLDIARERKLSQKRQKEVINLSKYFKKHAEQDSYSLMRDMETDRAYLSPQNSMSAIVNDAETLEEISKNFETMTVGLNGFAIVDLLDGRFEDFKDFAKEKKLRTYQFPLGTYYLSLLSVGERYAIPAGPHKYSVLDLDNKAYIESKKKEAKAKNEEIDENEFQIKKINPNAIGVFDRITSSIMFENRKKSMDLFICTCNYIGFDKETIADLIIDYYGVDAKHEIKNYILAEGISEFLEENPEYAEIINDARRKVSDSDIEKLIALTQEEELTNLKERILPAAISDQNLPIHYIEMQLREDRRKANYKRIIDFWDNLDHQTRSMCKTGIVRGIIKQFDETCLKNNELTDDFLKEYPGVRGQLELISDNNAKYRNVVKIQFEKLENVIDEQYKKMSNTKAEYQTKRNKLMQNMYEDKNYIELNEQLAVLKRKRSISEQGSAEKQKIDEKINKTRKEINKIKKQTLQGGSLNGIRDAYHSELNAYNELVKKSNNLYEGLEGKNLGEFMALNFYNKKLWLNKKLNKKFFRDLSLFEKKPNPNELMDFLGHSLTEKYGALTLDDIVGANNNAILPQLKANSEKIENEVKLLEEKTKNRGLLYSDPLAKLFDEASEYLCIEQKLKLNELEDTDMRKFYHKNIKYELGELQQTVKTNINSLYRSMRLEQNSEGKENEAENRSIIHNLNRLDELLNEKRDLFCKGDALLRNVVMSLKNRSYLGTFADFYNEKMYIAKGERHKELEEKGDTCPMGLSANWYTPKIRYQPQGFEFSQHFFGNAENRIKTGKEVPVKVEFHSYDDSFLMYFKGNNELKLTKKQAEDLLTNIETYALDAIKFGMRGTDKTTPKMQKSNMKNKVKNEDMPFSLYPHSSQPTEEKHAYAVNNADETILTLTGEDGRPYGLKATYFEMQDALYSASRPAEKMLEKQE